MANLTVVIDDDLLKRARIRALERGESVNSLLRDYLESFADAGRTAEAREALLALSRRSTSGSGGTRSWTREQARER